MTVEVEQKQQNIAFWGGDAHEIERMSAEQLRDLDAVVVNNVEYYRAMARYVQKQIKDELVKREVKSNTSLSELIGQISQARVALAGWQGKKTPEYFTLLKRESLLSEVALRQGYEVCTFCSSAKHANHLGDHD